MPNHHKNFRSEVLHLNFEGSSNDQANKYIEIKHNSIREKFIAGKYEIELGLKDAVRLEDQTNYYQSSGTNIKRFKIDDTLDRLDNFAYYAEIWSYSLQEWIELPIKGLFIWSNWSEEIKETRENHDPNKQKDRESLIKTSKPLRLIDKNLKDFIQQFSIKDFTNILKEYNPNIVGLVSLLRFKESASRQLKATHYRGKPLSWSFLFDNDWHEFKEFLKVLDPEKNNYNQMITQTESWINHIFVIRNKMIAFPEFKDLFKGLTILEAWVIKLIALDDKILNDCGINLNTQKDDKSVPGFIIDTLSEIKCKIHHDRNSQELKFDLFHLIQDRSSVVTETTHNNENNTVSWKFTIFALDIEVIFYLSSPFISESEVIRVDQPNQENQPKYRVDYKVDSSLRIEYFSSIQEKERLIALLDNSLLASFPFFGIILMGHAKIILSSQATIRDLVFHIRLIPHLRFLLENAHFVWYLVLLGRYLYYSEKGIFATGVSNSLRNENIIFRNVISSQKGMTSTKRRSISRWSADHELFDSMTEKRDFIRTYSAIVERLGTPKFGITFFFDLSSVELAAFVSSDWDVSADELLKPSVPIERYASSIIKFVENKVATIVDDFNSKVTPYSSYTQDFESFGSVGKANPLPEFAMGIKEYILNVSSGTTKEGTPIVTIFVWTHENDESIHHLLDSLILAKRNHK